MKLNDLSFAGKMIAWLVVLAIVGVIIWLT